MVLIGRQIVSMRQAPRSKVESRPALRGRVPVVQRASEDLHHTSCRSVIKTAAALMIRHAGDRHGSRVPHHEKGLGKE